MTGNELIKYIQQNNLYNEVIYVINDEGNETTLRYSEDAEELVVDSCFYA